MSLLLSITRKNAHCKLLGIEKCSPPTGQAFIQLNIGAPVKDSCVCPVRGVIKIIIFSNYIIIITNVTNIIWEKSHSPQIFNII